MRVEEFIMGDDLSKAFTRTVTNEEELEAAFEALERREIHDIIVQLSDSFDPDPMDVSARGREVCERLGVMVSGSRDYDAGLIRIHAHIPKQQMN